MNLRIPQIAVALVIGSGVLVLLGWQFNIELLKTGFPGNPITMKANTAFCFLLAGIALALSQNNRQRRRWYRLTLALAAVVIAVGALTLIEYGFGWNLHIDQLLFQHIATPNSYPGRMGESAALNFVLVGAALLWVGKNNQRSQWRAQSLSLLMIFIATVPLLGYLFQASIFYKLLVPDTSTSANTALTFLILGIGILFTRPQLGLMQTITSPLVGGLLARKLLPWAIALPLTLNWLVFQGHKLGFYDEPSSYALRALMNISLLSTIIYWNAYKLNGIEQERQAVHQQFSRAVLEAPLPIMIHAEDGQVLQVNKSWTEITGYQLQDIPTISDWIERAYRENKQSIRETINQLYNLDRRVDEGEFTIHTRTGETRIWNFHSAPLGRMRDGRRFVITTGLDITERKQAEATLLELNKTLENRVAERTSELEKLNAQLRLELQDRQRAEQAAQDSQAILNSIIESTQDYIVAMDTNYRYIAFNKSCQENQLRNFGIEIEIGKNCIEAWAQIPEMQVYIKTIADRVLSGEQFKVIEKLPDLKKEGQYYEINHNPIRDNQGQISGLCIIYQNVSERIEKEKALQDSEARFQAFMNHSPILGWITDREGKLIYCNNKLANLFRQPATELIGKTPFDLHPRDFAEEHVKNIQLVTDTGLVIETIEPALRADNSRGDFLVYKFPLQTEGEKHLVGGVGFDITEHKKAEQAVRESEAKLQAILDNAPAAIYLKDPQGRFLSVNRYCLDIFQLSPKEYQGKTSRELFPGQDSEELEAKEKQVWQTKTPHHLEEQFIQFDGIHTYNSVKFLLEDLAGNPYALCSISTDITARKLTEEALLEAKQTAENASTAKSVFLANMSHELRTPLNAILGFTQVLTRDSSLNQTQQEQIGIINRSGEHLLSLINDILEISKIEAGRVTHNFNSFDFYEMIDGIEAMLTTKAKTKNLQIICECDDCVPRYIKTDEGKLRQVLSNLLGNALKFTHQGGVSLRVRCPQTSQPLKSEDQITILFEVEDTGPGISQTELEHLFAPFVQSATGIKSQEGTGLGLAISRKLVQLMGGDITINSRLGEGTIVKFYIQATKTFKDDVNSLELPQIVELEPGQPIYRILVVDDRAESRLLLRHFLAPLGFEIREAENGAEAISVWEEWQPHLIWMDMRMPVMDGYEATKQIKNHLQGQATVVIALTASAFEENRSLILSAGCDDFVRKPCRQEVLLNKIAEHLGVRYIFQEQPVVIDNEEELSFYSWRHQLIGKKQQENIIDASALQVMPVEWIKGLHHAANCAYSRELVELINQIPNEYNSLAIILSEWVEDFRYDKITALIEEIIHE